MEQKQREQIDNLLNLSKGLTLNVFDEYIVDFLERKEDKKLAIHELDEIVALLQNHVQSLSLYLKQNYLLSSLDSISKGDDQFYTKQEVAIKYRVSVRTITNWIADGLAVDEIGGVKRISVAALQNFKNCKKRKKFNWLSIR